MDLINSNRNFMAEGYARVMQKLIVSSRTLIATSNYITVLVTSNESVSTKVLEAGALVAPFHLL